jgi:hypothetical protein
MSKYDGMPEQELKNNIGDDFFPNFNWKKIEGAIDFAVMPKMASNGQFLI